METAQRTQDQLARRITACRSTGVLPEDLLDLVSRVYGLQLAVREQARVTLPDSLPDAGLRAQGVSLVERGSFPFDRDQALELLPRLLETVAAVSPVLAGGCAVISAALADSSLDPDTAMQAYRRGDEAFFASWAARTPATPRMLPMLIQAAMTPSIEQAAGLLAASLDQNVTWPHGHCPVCGSLPLISDLREKEGFRFHVCSFCHIEYRATRMQCPYCLETDADKLTFYDIKEEPGFRINACSSCNSYIKVTDFRNMDRKSLPLIDDLDSLSLDILARDKKLIRPVLSAWGF